jgi:hypothetical protein
VRFVKAGLIKAVFLGIVISAGGCASVVRNYSGAPLPQDQVAVIIMNPRTSCVFTKGIQGVSRIEEIDGKPAAKVDFAMWRKKTELLPGVHTITGNVTTITGDTGYTIRALYRNVTITVTLEAGKVYELYNEYLREAESKKILGSLKPAGVKRADLETVEQMRQQQRN